MTGTRAPEPAAATGRLETLTADECRARLAAGRIGRVVFVDGRGPVALPVNYRVFEGDIVFRTAEISSLLGSSYVERVGFELDDIDEERRVGWSVLVTGRVRLVDDQAEVRALQELGVTPWAEGPRTQYLRLAVRAITGRRLVAGGDESSATAPT